MSTNIIKVGAKMNLKPSNIFYSQYDITETFGKKCVHRTRQIGETLDDLYYGRTSISNIPEITVVKKDGKWFTLDNRRLWIFHHLEGAGKLDTIHVNVETEISSRKYNTRNGGVSVKIYRGGDPGGKCRKYITPVTPTVPESEIPDSPKYADENDCVDEKEKETVEDLPAVIPKTSISVGNDIVPSTHESSDKHDIKAEPAFEENALNILGNTQEVLNPDIQTEENTEFKVKASQVSNEEEYEQHADSQETVKKHVEDVPAIIPNTNSVVNDIVPSIHEVLQPDIQTEENTEFKVKASQVSNEEEYEQHADSQETVKKHVEDVPAIIPNTISVVNDIVPSTHEVLQPDIQTEENTEFKVKASQVSNEEEYEQHAVSRESDSLSSNYSVCSSSDKDRESFKGNIICNGTRGIKRSLSTLGEHEDGAAEGKRVKLD